MYLLVIVIAIAAGVAALYGMIRTGKPVRCLLTSFIEGVSAIAAVNIAGIFTDVSLGFSYFTLGASALFGIPGVIGLLVMRLFAM